jgi:uncharacterized membrane protein YdbT with pleckstrin-like domain
MDFQRAPNEKIALKFTSGRFGWKYVKVYGILAFVFILGVFLFLYGDSLLAGSLRFIPFTPSGVSLYLIAAALVLALPVELKRRSLKYVITNYRVVEISGLLRKSVKALQISQINDVSVSQSLVDRIMGHGDVIVKTGTSLMEMVAVKNPSRIESFLMEHAGSRPSAPQKSMPPAKPKAKPSGEYATSSP